jgi:hypothetical protein
MIARLSLVENTSLPRDTSVYSKQAAGVDFLMFSHREIGSSGLSKKPGQASPPSAGGRARPDTRRSNTQKIRMPTS